MTSIRCSPLQLSLGYAAIMFALTAWLIHQPPLTAAFADEPLITNTGANSTSVDSISKQGNANSAIHWSYRPIQKTAFPDVVDAQWSLTPIDRWILRRLEQEGIRPNRTADRAKLYRRLCYDLWGLPPDPDEVDRFLQDTNPDALALSVDRMLADPRFGQHFARHWLDVVRYAESLTLRGFVFPHAWRYRDYVIGFYNDDRGVNQFFREQMAGDLLPAKSLEERQRGLVATTVFMLGNTNLEEQDKQQLEMDLIDDQIDLIGRGFLGQTLACARCHDHKYDPISIADYYALAGILKGSRMLAHENVSKWIEMPLPVAEAEEAVYQSHEKRLAQIKDQLQENQKQIARVSKSEKSTQVIALSTLEGIVVDDSQAKRVGEWQRSTSVTPYVGDGYVHDQNTGKGEKSLTFQPDISVAGEYEVRLAYTPGDNRDSRVPVTVFSADGEKQIDVNQKKVPPVERVFVSLGKYRFEANGAGYVIVGTQGTTGHVIADAVQFVPTVTQDKPIARSKTDSQTSQKLSSSELETLETLKRDKQQLEADLKSLMSAGVARPKVMTLIERNDATDLAIHLRGSVHSLGNVVPRGFPRFSAWPTASPEDQPIIPAGQSGRLQLADWLTGSAQPLSARVYVNRVWSWLFGTGLVSTNDNWGTTGAVPSHPELLDMLTQDFVDHGWSTKHLVRQIVLSRVYQLADNDSDSGLAFDPENRWLWRHVPRRLTAEELRDTLIVTSGRLEQSMGGPGFSSALEADYGFRNQRTVRSVYVPVFRNALPELFEAFDFADPSTISGNRSQSTVAPQALALLNLPFVRTSAEGIARRVLRDTDLTHSELITAVYRLLLGRMPSESERSRGVSFLETSALTDRDSSKTSLQDDLADFTHALMGTVEFRYIR